MTVAVLAGRLAAAGLDPAALPDIARLYEKALGGFRALSTAPPRHVWWVPGRLEVFGKHTDYAGGRTLAAALPRGFAFVASPRPDNELHVIDAATGERAIFGRGGAPAASWCRYVDAVVRRLTRNFTGARRGASIAFASNLPPAAGMSSSSALIVGTATALVRLLSIEDSAEWRANVTDLASRATYFAAIESGAAFGSLAGEAGVGTHGGSEDHAAMLLGVPDAVSAFTFVPLRRDCDAPVPAEWRFVAATSGVAAEKTGAVREQYNLLSRGASELLRLWNAANPPVRSLGAALRSGGDAIDRLRHLIRCFGTSGWSAGSLERRLEHFVREDARIADAVRAFRERDCGALTDLAIASQQDAEELLGNQIPDTVRLVACARRRGAFAACSFGAGFGGGAWALIDRNEAEAFREAWMEEYRRGSQQKSAVAFVATPGPAVTELS